MSSLRRILASRANRRRSHGPVTPASKQKSSQNAPTHGLLATCLVLDDERRETFQELLDEPSRALPRRPHRVWLRRGSGPRRLAHAPCLGYRNPCVRHRDPPTISAPHNLLLVRSSVPIEPDDPHEPNEPNGPAAAETAPETAAEDPAPASVSPEPEPEDKQPSPAVPNEPSLPVEPTASTASECPAAGVIAMPASDTRGAALNEAPACNNPDPTPSTPQEN